MFPFTFSEAAELCGISKSQEADFFWIICNGEDCLSGLSLQMNNQE